MLKPVLNRPLAMCVLAFMVGIVAEDRFELPMWPAVAGIFLAFIAALSVKKRRILLLSIVMFAGFLSGIVRMESYLDIKHKNIAWIKAEMGREEKILIRAKLSGPIKLEHGSTNFVITDIEIIENDSIRRVSGQLSLWAQGKFLDARAGDTIMTRGNVKPISNRVNPGVSTPRWSSREKNSGYFYVSHAESIAKLAREVDPDLNISDKLERFRERLRGFMITRYALKEGMLMRALIIGDRYAVGDETSDLFSRLGTSHLLSVSGLHMTMIAFLAYMIVYRILLFIPALPLHINIRSIAAASSLIPLVGYVALTSSRLPTVRASIVVFVYVLSVIFDKDSDIYTTLSFAAMIILAIWPFSLFDPAFVLSFGSVISIVYVHPRIFRAADTEGKGTTLLRKALTYVLLLFVSALSVNLGLAPLTSMWFNYATPFALIANIPMVPLYAGLAVPMGLLSVALLPVSTTLAVLARDISHWLISLGEQLSQLMASIPNSSTLVYSPSFVEMTLWWSTLLVVLGFVRKSEFISRASLAKVLLVLAMIWCGDVAYWYVQRNFRSEPRLTFLDVGQGEATVLELPPDKVVLVDGGGAYSGSYDAGESITGPFMLHRKITEIVAVIASHPHMDHIGGLSYIIGNFDVSNLFIPPGFEETEDARKLLDLAGMRGVKIRRVHAESPSFKIGGCKLSFLGPPKEGFRDRNGNMMMYYANDNSLVPRFNCGNFTAVFTGDIQEKGEKALLQNKRNILMDGVTVIKLPHHGREEALSLTRISDPLVGVISGNPPKDGPLPALTEELKELGTALYATKEHGGITIKVKKDGLDISTSKSGGEN